MSRHWGLLGKSLSHSFSKDFFEAKFKSLGLDATYTLFERSTGAEVLDVFQNQEELEGLNVTVPFKTEVIPYLDELTPTAKAIGAVNVIRREFDGRLIGHNSDAEGFAQSLRPFLTGDHHRAMVIGAGGAAAAVRYALTQLGIEVVHLVRRDLSEETPYRWARLESIEAESVKHFRLLVQATPVGTAPDVKATVDFPWEGITDRHFAVDLIYNPKTTEFLKRAKARGAMTLNGTDMLHLQAERSWEFWTRHSPSNA